MVGGAASPELELIHESKGEGLLSVGRRGAARGGGEASTLAAHVGRG